MDRKHRAVKGIIFFLFIGILIFGGVMVNYLYLNPSQFFDQKDLLRRIEVLIASLAFIANLGLTAGLIYIYLNQNRVLRQEISVLESQQELMQTQQQPVIDGPYNLHMFGKKSQSKSSVLRGSNNQFHLTDIAWIPEGLKIKGSVETKEDSVSIDTGEETSDQELTPPEDGIRFRLSNSGGGPAKKFRLWTRLIVHDGPHKGGWTRSPLKRMDRDSLYKYADNIIQPGEQDLGFQGPVQLKIENPPDGKDENSEFDTYDFSKGVQKLVEEGTKEIEITLKLRYEDTFGENYENQFFHHRADITHDMDLTEFVQQKSPTVRFINTSLQEKSKLDKIRSILDGLMDRVRRVNQN